MPVQPLRRALQLTVQTGVVQFPVHRWSMIDHRDTTGENHAKTTRQAAALRHRAGLRLRDVGGMRDGAERLSVFRCQLWRRLGKHRRRRFFADALAFTNSVTVANTFSNTESINRDRG